MSDPSVSVALITSMASTIPNFRGTLIRQLVDLGARVYALAPDCDERIRERVVALNAMPQDISMERTGMRPSF